MYPYRNLIMLISKVMTITDIGKRDALTFSGPRCPSIYMGTFVLGAKFPGACA
jgi:hypothetical protein